MIPFFRLTTIPLGPIQIQVWGLFVALGMGVALFFGQREAARRDLSREQFIDFACWILVGALLGARIFYAIAYQPNTYLADPLKILRVWEGGMSSFGGFFGAAIGAFFYARRAGLSFMKYANVAAYVLPLGYGIGRIGCFLIHDHPGTLSHSLLAVRYPGGARLDHGLLLSLLGFALFVVFFFINRRHKGFSERGFLFLFMLCYGVVRFFLDFYRAWDLPGADLRFFLLTPAQYGCLLFIAVGILGLAKYTYVSTVQREGN